MVTLLTLSEERAGRVSLRIDDGGSIERYSVSRAVYGAVGSPIPKDILTEEQLCEIKREDEKYRAMKKALSLLSYSDKSQKTLYLKLRRSGFSHESSSEAASRCVELGYLNETNQLERAVLSEANLSLRGPYAVRNKMLTKGYSAEQIDSVWESLVESGDINPMENFKKLCEKKKVTSEEERRALRYKYGYGSFEE